MKRFCASTWAGSISKGEKLASKRCLGTQWRVRDNYRLGCVGEICGQLSKLSLVEQAQIEPRVLHLPIDHMHSTPQHVSTRIANTAACVNACKCHSRGIRARRTRRQRVHQLLVEFFDTFGSHVFRPAAWWQLIPRQKHSSPTRPSGGRIAAAAVEGARTHRAAGAVTSTLGDLLAPEIAAAPRWPNAVKTSG